MSVYFFNKTSKAYIWITSVFIGFLGGFSFYLLNLPLPWMLGAIFLCLIAAFCKKEIGLPKSIQKNMLAILGVFLGGTFKPELKEHVVNWLPSLSILGLFVFICVIILYIFFTKIIKLDSKTAYFSSSPGGMTQMVFISREAGADDRIVALIHAIRVLMVVFTVPFMFKLFTNYTPPDNNILMNQSNNITAKEIIFLCLAIFVGLNLGKKLKFPAHILTGPMLAGAVLYISGICQNLPPKEIIWFSQLIVGVSIGSRFSGIDFVFFKKTIISAILSTTILLFVGFSFALFISEITNLPFYALLLSYAPGGVADMCLISLSLGIDVAFVSAHHIIRIVYIVVFMPFFFRLEKLKRKRRNNSQREKTVYPS